MAAHRVIFLQPAAPPKPAAGDACNGCGVCCTTQPCPLGMVMSRTRRGACVALEWRDDQRLYRCGVVQQPSRWLGWLGWLPAPLVRQLALRWIAASHGCDSSLEARSTS